VWGTIKEIETIIDHAKWVGRLGGPSYQWTNYETEWEIKFSTMLA